MIEHRLAGVSAQGPTIAVVPKGLFVRWHKLKMTGMIN